MWTLLLFCPFNVGDNATYIPSATNHLNSSADVNVWDIAEWMIHGINKSKFVNNSDNNHAYLQCMLITLHAWHHTELLRHHRLNCVQFQSSRYFLVAPYPVLTLGWSCNHLNKHMETLLSLQLKYNNLTVLITAIYQLSKKDRKKQVWFSKPAHQKT